MATTMQRSFTAGEIAPAVRSRADLVKYTTGLALCQNMIVRPQGGVYSRPGLRYVGKVYDSSKRARLIPFSFNTEQTYALLFEEDRMRVIRDGGFILEATQSIVSVTLSNPVNVEVTGHSYSTGDDVELASILGTTELNGRTARITVVDPNNFTLDDIDGTGYTAYISGGTVARLYTLTIPYQEADLPRLQFVQDADVMTIVHPDYDPRRLSRVTETNWTLTAVSFAPTVTAPGALTLAVVGSGAGANNKTYGYVVTVVDANGVESLPSPANTITTPSLSETAGVRITWTAVGGADYYRVYKDPSVGTGVYGWIGDTKNATFDDYNIGPITSDAPPEDNQPFTGVGNKPATVGYHQQRQIFGNLGNEPQSIFMTQVANEFSLRFSTPSRSDDSITFTIKAQQVNEVRHFVSLNALLALTSGGEWKLTEGQDDVLTPETIGAKIQSYNGASWVSPVVIDDTAIYIQAKGARVRDLSYTFQNDKYSGNDLSVMSEHLFEGYTIEEMAFAKEPYGVMWAVRDDGVLLGLTYQREHQVWAWHQHTTDGTFESVITIEEGSRDTPYVIVRRTINGENVRYVEYMEQRFETDPMDVFCVDSGLSYNGSAITEVGGLWHLENKNVAAVADGNEVTGLTVTNGQITLPQAAEKISVGLAYTPVIETLEIDSAASNITLKDKEMNVAKLTIEFYKTRGGWVGPINQGVVGKLNEIKPRFDVDSYTAIQLRTYKAEIFVEPDWNKSGAVRIEQRAPFPMAILSVIPDVSMGG